jgi:DNA-binding winged helix-turn-helix (wHTH) protein/Tol biopolymer transport system component
VTFLPVEGGGALVYQFGDFTLNPGEFRLARKGVPVALDPKSMGVLRHLLEKRGYLVRKQELLDSVWSDANVMENALTRVIATLRKALDDDSRTPRFIETVPTLGYRFIAEVSVDASSIGTVFGEVALDGNVPDPQHVALPEKTTAPNLSRRRFLWAAAGVGAVAAGSGMWVAGRKKHLSPAMNVAIPMEDNTTAADAGHLLGAPVIAPDGSSIVVSLRTPDGAYLFRRPLQSANMVRIAGTQYATLPFWSPDSQHIGFFADGKLKRMPAFGGSPITLCEVLEPRGGCWAGENILFGANLRAIFRIGSTGGDPAPVTTLDTEAGENSHRFPVFLPDGNRFLYFSRTSSVEKRGIYLESLDRKQPRRRVVVADGEFAVGAVPGSGDHFLITQQAGKLIAQKFNCGSGKVFGPEHLLLDHAGQVSASETGVLALRTNAQVLSRIVWRDRNGRMIGTLGKPDDYWQVALSPDERFVAMVRHDGSTGQFRVWTASLPDGAIELISDSDHVDSIAWAHDSRMLYYVDFVQKKLFRRRVLPRGPEELVRTVATGDNLRSLSPDGALIVVERSKDGVHSVIEWSHIDPLQWHLVDSSGFMSNTSLSPDGKSLAFGSSRTGEIAVYLAEFPELKNLRRVSADGGCSPRWRRDGKELFYIANDEFLMSLHLSGSERKQGSRPEALFRTALTNAAANPLYDVAGDGSRFLLVERDNSINGSVVELLLNWPSLISD